VITCARSNIVADQLQGMLVERPGKIKDLHLDSNHQSPMDITVIFGKQMKICSDSHTGSQKRGRVRGNPNIR